MLNIYGNEKLGVTTLRQWQCVSAVATLTSHVLCDRTQLSHHEMKGVSISSSRQIDESQAGNCVWSWISAFVHWKQCWPSWNITVCTRWVTWMLVQEEKEHHIQHCIWETIEQIWGWTWQFHGWVTRCSFTSISRSQNDSPWSDDMLIPLWKSSRCVLQWVKHYALSFGTLASHSFRFPRTQTSHQLWLLRCDADYVQGSNFLSQTRKDYLSFATHNTRSHISLKTWSTWSMLPMCPTTPAI